MKRENPYNPGMVRWLDVDGKTYVCQTPRGNTLRVKPRGWYIILATGIGMRNARSVILYHGHLIRETTGFLQAHSYSRPER